jgi:hypothetical protein
LWHDRTEVAHAYFTLYWISGRTRTSEAREALELDSVGIELLLLLYVVVCLQDLIDSLLYDSHVCHHVILSHALCTQKLNVRLLIALNEVEYLLHAGHNGFEASLRVVIVHLKPLRVTLYSSQLLLHSLDVLPSLHVQLMCL